MCNFIAKALIGGTCMIWIRWSLPRLRVDQVITTCLKYCVPLASAMLAGAMLWNYNFPNGVVWRLWHTPAAVQQSTAPAETDAKDFQASYHCPRQDEECKMQNAKCKMQSEGCKVQSGSCDCSRMPSRKHFAFCTLHFAFCISSSRVCLDREDTQTLDSRT